MATSKKSAGEKTSSAVAKKASSHLRSGATNAASKKVAGSALSQVKPGKETSKPVAKTASKKLASSTTGAKGRSIAASVLTQAADAPRKSAKRATAKKSS
ncbi:hypothetical protein [Piscinibacter koreensis]|uniref:Uncharacterized protein n=1 Tax=Piscinibacter koreensis TaxID=2742824 RepID=A0A7Y6NPC6_9BURK|nr:hypothetical protein [Schlegelella koreensis]NUZ06734.1 hypothetical protein [Schlegelella koreensis]